MKWLDQVLRNWRIRKALPHTAPAERLLDVGCGDGELLRQLDRNGMGIDPRLGKLVDVPGVQFVRGNFPDDLPVTGPFDAITMLAVLEHVPEPAKPAWPSACHRLLAVDGRVVLTVPSPRIDAILAVLRFFRLVDGMALEEHHGFNPSVVKPLFESAGFRLAIHKKFQLGLNNLFVFTKIV